MHRRRVRVSYMWRPGRVVCLPNSLTREAAGAPSVVGAGEEPDAQTGAWDHLRGGGEPSTVFHACIISSHPQDAIKPSMRHDVSKPTANSV